MLYDQTLTINVQFLPVPIPHDVWGRVAICLTLESHCLGGGKLLRLWSLGDDWRPQHLLHGHLLREQTTVTNLTRNIRGCTVSSGLIKIFISLFVFGTVFLPIHKGNQ